MNLTFLKKGDLTDAKNQDMIGSRQYEHEWKTYQQIIEDNKVLEKTVWLDVRGNHGKIQSILLFNCVIQVLCKY